ncbi:MAG: HEAT repeat domain-containing protein [Candidatus Cloacimonetes bacterium]|nr:HEAT repeat domain-containing protein [Candidatus Cloacimonadota bacterium]
MFDKKFWLLLLLLCLCQMASAFISESIVSATERQAFTEMLQSQGFEETDLNFLKDWDASTKFKLSVQVDALNNPWKFIDLLDTLKYRIETLGDNGLSTPRKLLSSYIGSCSDFTDLLDIPLTNEQIIGYTERLHQNSPQITKPKDCFSYMENLFSIVESYLKQGFINLTAAQQDSLSHWLYSSWQESEDSLANDNFFKEKYPNLTASLKTEGAIRLLEKIDWQSLALAWRSWEQGCRMLSGNVYNLMLKNKKPVYHNSRWGTMIIGSIGNDHYTNDKRLRQNPVCFLLEPSGNDTYDCDLYTDKDHPFYLVIDLKGSDVYRNPSIAKGMCVLAGCGTVIDFEGDDIYQYGDFAMSALLGFNSIIDYKGNDYYSTGLFSQGAAMFGISTLLDNEGNDTYTATEFAQGMGGTKGLGLLLDGKGNDVYYCGGKYLHKPLAPFDYRSMGQGFGFGFRSDLAGGIGILYDGEGNDRYSGGVYAQGVAYWYAIGALFDEKGNDYYDAVYYPQGSGIHLANGALCDMEGEDHYYSKHGPGQGNGHDWSVGVFIDRKGNDHYSVEGGNGLGLTNSVGIFLDSEGNDKYEHRNPSNYGYANSARETGGIGLFLDAGGKDVYPDTTKADNKTWQQGTYGIGRDLELNIAAPSKVEELAEQSVADVDSLASIDKLFAIASEWEVGSAAKRVKLAREYLLERDAEAVPYALKTKMATKSGLEYRALSELVKKSVLMQTSLYAVLLDADSLKVKNAIALLGERADSTALDSLSVFLKQNKYIPAVLSALGYIKTARSQDLIAPYLYHHTEKYRFLAARSLKAMNTPQSLALLRKMDKDTSFLVKAMVRQLQAEK